ncbi:MAG: hypothetical protein ACK5EO_17750 [Planctomycetota bacterium]|jgi:hypothetical protein
MSDEKKSKLIERDKAMRIARDEMLRLVWLHLVNIGFKAKSPGHYVREIGTETERIGFQKHSSGRDVRVMCHVEINDPVQTVISGPWSDSYAGVDSPNGIRYHFGWSTREQDVIRCAGEYSRFINDVILPWFASRSHPQEMA